MKDDVNAEFMLRFLFLIVMGGLLLLGCRSDSPEVIDPTPVPITATPDPTKLTSVEQIAGIWLGTVAGENGYIMYTNDSTYALALIQDDLTTAPRVTGEYWFENGQLHLRDLENAGHWVVCDQEVTGIYDVMIVDNQKVQFETIDDACNEGGFTRNYIFANMLQEWISEPVPASP